MGKTLLRLLECNKIAGNKSSSLQTRTRGGDLAENWFLKEEIDDYKRIRIDYETSREILKQVQNDSVQDSFYHKVMLNSVYHKAMQNSFRNKVMLNLFQHL